MVKNSVKRRKIYTYSVDIWGIVEYNFYINFGYWMVSIR